jgi:hypothetical protein
MRNRLAALLILALSKSCGYNPQHEALPSALEPQLRHDNNPGSTHRHPIYDSAQNHRRT